MASWLTRNRNFFRLRAWRQYLLLRAIRRRNVLVSLRNQTDQIKPHDLLAFVTLRNEYLRLPWFLDYYRKQGINHFLIVDNDSDDGSREYLAEQPDISVWTTTASYKASRFGMDWLNWLLFRYGSGHWCLTVDPDELLVYPHCDSRPLRALTDWLDASAQRSFPAMLLDMYPQGPISAHPYSAGQDPLEIASWFDPANYTIRKNGMMGNLWIQGGPRARRFFRNQPNKAPALNKTPLVRWRREYAYVSSTHMLLPRSLNLTYAEDGGEKASGVLLHTKFLSTFIDKSAEELDRKQHYANSQEYRAYHAGLQQDELDLWCEESVQYQDWRQLEDIGLISQGNWA
ncbi:MAG: glycosyltransferase family 2 protein [Paracoccus sp. (in: a-proteobacteria)]|uniref:glycosyltransferase family 2 protein n=1 Tax=Paracoccus sp. TaxID=267 RepID=UPI0026DF9BB1|nr:glycosyltransferase family 2 protein [Paracoccus sp. (in: a-proteobacteria)]MDO5621741.1 glycosyltransferase family 2 protein [Paracoccus sp. (in: a-proteobacteria)]